MKKLEIKLTKEQYDLLINDESLCRRLMEICKLDEIIFV